MVRGSWFVIFLCLVVVAPCVQAEEKKRPKHSSRKENQPFEDPFIKLRLTTEEQDIIREYFRRMGGPPSWAPAAGKKKKNLPPGLRKKLARGGELPPGWQKNVARGEVLDDDVFWQSHPLPSDLADKLPQQPPGTIIVTIGGKAVRLFEATRTIIDILDL